MTLKEKLAVAKRKEYLLIEIKNYTAAMNGRDDRFNNYYEQRIADLNQELLTITGE
jgi:hypothetical protein